MNKVLTKVDGYFNRFLVDKIAKYAIYFFAGVSVLLSLSVVAFVIFNGIPIFVSSDVQEILFTTNWHPSQGAFGAFSIILGSILVTLLAMAFALFIAVGCAVLLAEVAPSSLRRIMRPLIELLAGIPSVVYGLLGVMLLVPFIGELTDRSGFSFLAAGLVLGIMVLPTIISISEDAIRAVPESYNQGALALGCSRWQSIRSVVFPAALVGVIAAITLGIGRAIGETMAVMMIIGNSVGSITSLFDPGRTIPSTIGGEMAYAEGEHLATLYGLALVLTVFVLLINSVATLFLKRKAKVNHE